MRILVVSQYFWPENFRINDLCQGLIGLGHQVTVLTGKPNYPQGKIFPEYKASPDNFNSYNGIEIVRVPLVPRGKSQLSLLLNYISFPVSGILWGYFKLRKRKFDVVLICQLSPIFSAYPGIFFARRKGLPVAMWVLDLWPDSVLTAGYNNRVIYFLLKKIVSNIYSKVDHFFVQNESFRKNIISNGGLGKKFSLLPNWAEDIFEPKTHFKQTASSKLKILFAGNIGEAQDIPSVINAAKLLKARGIPALFIFVGSGRGLDRSLQLIKEFALEDFIQFFGEKPLNEMPVIYEQADVFFASLSDLLPFQITTPGKIPGYMFMAKPILTMITGEASKVVEDAKCGFTAKSGDYEKLASNIELLVGMSAEEKRALGLNARKFAKENFDRKLVLTSVSNQLMTLRSYKS